jgi:hypothetical protein
VLSIIISDWDRADEKRGLPKAREADRETLIDGVLQQINADLVGQPDLRRSDISCAFFDPGLHLEEGPRPKVTNDTKLLMNAVNTWGMRPNSFTEISNLFLAGDWVFKRPGQRWFG